jgi:predicted helicase
MYRPFEQEWLYYDSTLNEVQYQTHRLFHGETPNPAITSMGDSTGKPYFTLAIDSVPDLNFVSPASGGTMTFARYRYGDSGDRVDNITDWAVKQFEARYGKEAGTTKDAIFTYCYAVLHDPVYREKYALNLKREFPRIPLYDNFAQWAGWGQQLLDLHIGYEKAKPFKFTRIDEANPKRAKGSHPKPKLKSDSDGGQVIVDEDTQLNGIPREAWDYRLGNRSAIDWVLDQHKEKTPRDPTIRAKFNTYRFADYKEEMIKLLARVVTVSLETVKITEAMRALARSTVEAK